MVLPEFIMFSKKPLGLWFGVFIAFKSALSPTEVACEKYVLASSSVEIKSVVGNSLLSAALDGSLTGTFLVLTEQQRVMLLSRSPSGPKKYFPIPVENLEEEIRMRSADEGKLFREEFNVSPRVWSGRPHGEKGGGESERLQILTVLLKGFGAGCWRLGASALVVPVCWYCLFPFSGQNHEG